MTTLWMWRHPRAIGAEGRCIGQTDLPVDPRKAKRLAHRIRASARRNGLPREVWTSPLARCRDVGRWLGRWGWLHRVDARLMELDFGRWDGLPWTCIANEDVACWEADFKHHAPGGGESLAALITRATLFHRALANVPDAMVVTHAGWIQSTLHAIGDASTVTAPNWPKAVRHGLMVRVVVQI